MGIGTCIGLAACGGTGSTETSEVTTNLQTIDNSKWQYNSDDDVYYQIGISYCEDPADESYETLAVFVPGAYMDATDNGDGTYTCELNTTAEVNGYTAETAPIVMPVNTPGYSATLAAKIALEGYDVTGGAFFFLNTALATSSWIPRNRPYAFTIGNHDFYY